MKIYVITISDVYDYEGFHHAPIVKKSMDDAKKALHKLHDEVKEEMRGYGNDDWVEDDFDENSTCFSMYPDGYWGTSHYDAVIDEVEVED